MTVLRNGVRREGKKGVISIKGSLEKGGWQKKNSRNIPELGGSETIGEER